MTERTASHTALDSIAAADYGPFMPTDFAHGGGPFQGWTSFHRPACMCCCMCIALLPGEAAGRPCADSGATM